MPASLPALSMERAGRDALNSMKTLFNLKTLPFWTLLALVITLATATFVEKYHGTEYTYQYIYGSWWFTALWATLVVLTLTGIYKSKSYQNLPLFFFHLSFVVILLGALCTKLGGKQGYVVLKQGEVCTQMQSDDAEPIMFPFEISLDTFYVSYYPGTNAPADYISEIHVYDNTSGKATTAQVSMNNIFSYKNFRFYQSSFEPGGKTSILSVNHDVWGIPITYTGYALFALSMLWLLFSKKNQFRNLLANPLLKKTMIVILCLLPSISMANILTKDSLTVNTTQAAQFGKLCMLYDGRITPVATFAHDFTLKLTGKTKFSYLNSEQFLMGFLFFPEKWQQVALFKIEDPLLQKELNATVQKASFSDFFDEEGNYKLSKYWNEFSHSGAKTVRIKEVEKLNEKIQLINMLHNGTLLQMFPLEKNGQLHWYHPVENFSPDVLSQNITFIRAILTQYHAAVHQNDEAQAVDVLNRIDQFQRQHAGKYLPTDQKRAIEIFYLKHNFTSILFMLNLTMGILALLSLFILSPSKRNGISNILYFILVASFLLHCVSIAVRTYIGGRLPFGNGFETMLLIAWCSMFIALLFGKKIPFILPFGFLISGCALLVAHLGMMNPKITPLVPVLSSPLLSIHVSTIMISYTLLAFVALNSLVSLLLIIFLPSKSPRRLFLETRLEQHKIYSLICLYPALFFLGVGIFIGAVWANVSWGRYWGWDPKEVWALITFLVYSFIFHIRNIKFLSSNFSFHVFGLLSFSTVLMTYFGVNYFLGGMHSYAGGDMGAGLHYTLTGVLAALLIVGIAFARKQISNKL